MSKQKDIKNSFENLSEKYNLNLSGISKIKNYSIHELLNKNKIFQAASISKCLTSLCVMKLVEKNELSLNKDVNNYLKTWKVKDKQGKLVKVTLKQLLSHTAGISCSGFIGYNKKQNIPSITKILKAEKPANNEEIFCKYKKGSFHYSGGGYVIIQKVLEDVLGKRFNQIMKEIILRPLNMTKSTFGFPRSKNFANGYSDGKKVNYNIYPEKAAAGLWTTAEDLSKFLITVQKCYLGKSGFLSKELTRKMLKPIINAEGNFMALGFFISKNKRQFYHPGQNVGFRSNLLADFKGNGVIILTNEQNAHKFIKEVIKLNNDQK